MRSRAARLTSSAFAWLALGGAAFFVISTERSIATRRTTLRAFDQRAREAATALADARSAQQAYAAQGQSATFWMSKVASLVTDARSAVDRLRELAGSPSAGPVLLDAASAITEFNNIDRRARDYLRTGELLMASDVVFTEGAETAGHAARQVETARLAEHDAAEAYEADQHRRAAYAAGGAAGLATLVLLLLAFAPATQTMVSAQTAPSGDDASLDLSLRDMAPAVDQPVTVSSEPGAISDSTLEAAAELCTEFGRMRDLADLQSMVGRAAELMDASGLVVWLGDSAGADLQPMLAHGYGGQVLALLKPVARTADNAVAAAYRSGTPQVVSARPGTSPGAVVAPLLAPDGCIGALTAEIRHGGETSSRVQSLASIFAAQLAGVLAPSAAAPKSDATRTA